MVDESDPPDQAARHRVATDLDSTLFVDAGAGSGKTTALVSRVIGLVTSGETELAAIAAITFTEKAGAELRDRIRQELQRRVDRGPDSADSARCRIALEQLDGAAIGTLHSFAQRILSEHPLEAALPPRLEVLDEVSSGVAFEQRWATFQDELLADPVMERSLLLLFASGVRPEALRALALAFEENWDLVEEQVPAGAPEPPSARDLLADAAQLVREVCAEPCRDPSDSLRLRLDEIAEYLRGLLEIDDELDLLEALDPAAEPRPPSFRVGRRGSAKNFADPDAVRARVAAAGERLAQVRSDVASACAHRIGSALRHFTLASARERQEAGRLQFHDLLVLGRALLRSPEHGPEVRAHLHDRYQRLLLDEFQDTDPIQVELAVRIAAAEPRSREAGEAPWDVVETTPGRLFFVGDPKQSIYRFRRADISIFLEAARRFGSGGGPLELTANFRSAKPIVEWVNATFRELMEEPSDGDPLPSSQPDYVALDPTRAAPGIGPAVSVLGRTPHPKELPADELRETEAGEVATAIARILHERWDVEDKAGGRRAAELGDITVLVPSRTSLPFLEDALEEAGIPYRAEASSLVYASRAVRDLLMVLRAVDDPTNYLHIVSALRTPLLACGDDDLFRFRSERRGRWSYLADQPDTVPVDDPVRASLEYLRSVYDDRHYLAPSELLEQVVVERRVLELGFLEGRPRDLWRRVRFVVDQARAWSEATGGNLRQYLAWVARQASEGARVAEAVLPEVDDDAVRILTIHAAKGLEFPVTVVSGMSTVPGGRRASAEVVFPRGGGVGYRFGSQVVTEEFSDWQPIDEQMALHERIRLLYVACTRARDHLVVSLHRKARPNAPKPSSRTNAELLVAGTGQLLAGIADGNGEEGAIAPVVITPPASPPPPLLEWNLERSAALSAASGPRTIAATALSDEGTFDIDADPDPGLEKRPVDIDLPPWLKGRYGTSIGRAVHGVLQSVDLVSGGGLDALVGSQCEAEAVSGREADVRKLVADALASATVTAAARSSFWREVYFCTPVGDYLLEGYVDLLYRAPDGLVVVDYKTAATADAGELARRVELYRNQGAAYALGIEAVAGAPVVRVIFVFLTPGGAREYELPAIDDAAAHVRELAAAGRAVLAP